MSRVFAVDIGASSYRVIEGCMSEEGISMREFARFRHAPVWEDGHYYWDIDKMLENLLDVIREEARRGEAVSSIGFDTFGTDFGLIGKDGRLLSKPLAYRDDISDRIYEKYFQQKEKELYERVGGTFTNTSTAHLLMGMKEQGMDILEKAGRLLFLPDLLAFLFTGNAVNEYTIATSSRLLDAKKRQWDKELIRNLGLPEEIFHPLSDSGTIIGTLTKETAAGIPNLMHTVVTAAACHDTASAVTTIKEMRGCSFISSGSWSVKGIVSDRPYTTPEACLYQMSNEGQPDGKYRLIRNISGLWIVEECMRTYRENCLEVNIPKIAEEAGRAKEFPAMIYTDARDFEKPGHMPEKIQDFCKRTGQKVPRTPVEVFQAVIAGLACEYRRHSEELLEVTGEKIHSLYIVGGGSRNNYLNQCAADVTGSRVLCGHPEATALGNLLIQMKAQGGIQSVEEPAQKAVEGVWDRQFIPVCQSRWEEKYQQYLRLREG